MWNPEDVRKAMSKAMAHHGKQEWLRMWNELHPWRSAAKGFTWGEYLAKKRANRALA